MGKLLEQNFPPEKVVVHYTGVDTNLFSPAQDRREPMVLFVGRLSERKGPHHLIRAMASVQQEYPETELVLIGDGPLRKNLNNRRKTASKNTDFWALKRRRQSATG